MRATCTQAHGKLRCDRKDQHTGPHRDPETGTEWQHPAIPYGMRYPKKGKA